MGSMLEVIWGFALFAVGHSLLLTAPAHRALEALLGEERGKAWFRLVYSSIAFLWFGLYLLWVVALPDQEWFRITGFLAALLYLVKLGGALLVYWGVAQFGFASFLGLKAVKRYEQGEDPVLGDPDRGPIIRTGPYAFIRHPLYTGGIVAVVADPVWSANKFGFAVAAVAYLILGGLLEERRLIRLHGDAYRKYMEEVPGFIPRLGEGWHTKRG